MSAVHISQLAALKHPCNSGCACRQVHLVRSGPGIQLRKRSCNKSSESFLFPLFSCPTFGFLFPLFFEFLSSTLSLFLPNFWVLVPALFPFLPPPKRTNFVPTFRFLFSLCSTFFSHFLVFLFLLCFHSCLTFGFVPFPVSYFCPILVPLCSYWEQMAARGTRMGPKLGPE